MGFACLKVERRNEVRAGRLGKDAAGAGRGRGRSVFAKSTATALVPFECEVEGTGGKLDALGEEGRAGSSDHWPSGLAWFGDVSAAGRTSSETGCASSHPLGGGCVTRRLDAIIGAAGGFGPPTGACRIGYVVEHGVARREARAFRPAPCCC
jgi:hypothetical protein